MKELMSTERFINYEKEYIHKNGNLVSVRLSGNIFEKDGENLFGQALKILQNVKKQKN